MKKSRIIVLRNYYEKPQASEDAVVISFEELRNWLRKGTYLQHLFAYKEAVLITYRQDLMVKPFFTALLLRLFSYHRCSWQDMKGHQDTLSFRFLVRLLIKLCREWISKKCVLRETLLEAKSVEEGGGFTRNMLDVSQRPVYLRTELSFGIRSGGSVSHVAGVLNSMEHFTGKPIFLTTDSMPTVNEKVETHIIIPRNVYWDFMDIPSFDFNRRLYDIACGILTNRALSFIYQRYSLNNFVGIKLAQKYDIPFVLEYNGSEIWIHRYWGRALKYEKLSERIELLNLRTANVIVVVSQPMKDELVSRGIDAKKILVNPNGVDPNHYSPNAEGSGVRRQYHFNGRIVVGFIGTFGKWHGAEILAEAFGMLLHRYPEYQRLITLFMIGDGITMPLVKRNIDKFAIKESCVLTGLIPQEEGPKYLAACDILVSPHKPNPDGTPFFGSPTKLFEYMAMSKGIVASNLNQIGEVLKHDQTAWLVKPGDVESLMEGLKVLIDDAVRRKRLGQAARNEVVAKYTWKEHTRRIIEKLKEQYQ
jgi:glycosyltransferase involved in cell wall biosynthesis